ncbi:ATP-dependent RNA helicase dbp4, partial [Spiromyces aspiralis]
GGTGDDSAKRIASNPVKVITINPDTGLPVVVPNIPADQMTKRQIYKTKAKIIKNTRNTRVVFDDEGNARPVYELEDEATFRKQGPIDKLVEEHVQKNKELMEHEDVIDRALDKEKRRQKRLLKKQREREAMGETGSAPVAVLGSPEFDGSDGGDEEEEKNYYSNDDDNTDRSGKRSRDKGSSGDSDAEEGEPDETKSEAKKRRKLSKRPKVLLEVSETPSTLEDQENLALRLLGMG